MLLILLHVLTSYVFFWVTGYMTFSLAKVIAPPRPYCVMLPLTGFLILIPVLSLVSLFFPLNLQVLLSLFILQLILFLLKNNPLKKYNSVEPEGKKTDMYQSPWIRLIMLSLVILLFTAASVMPDLSDFWGYHAQTIQWIEKYPVVPGLGNLCTKYSFNFGSFLPMALLSFRSIAGFPLLTLNILLLLLLIMYLAHLLQKEISFWTKITLWLVVLFILHYFKPSIPTTSVECTSSVLIVFALSLIIQYPSNFLVEASKGIQFLFMLMMIVLPVIKISNIMFVMLLLPFFLEIKRRGKILLLVGMLLIWLPWITRNVIQSGYLLYPFPYLDFFGFDWKIPREVAFQDFRWIRSWARLPYLSETEVLDQSFRYWFIPWASRVGFLSWALILSGIIVSLIAGAWQKSRRLASGMISWFFFINIITLFAWFVFAPDPRFVVASLLLFAAIPSWALLSSLRVTVNKIKTVRLLFLPTLIFVLFEIAVSYPLKGFQLIKPAPFPVKEMKTENVGCLSINLPVEGVNCYDYPLPCAPFLRDGLTPRGVDLKSGFKIINPPLENHLTIDKK